MPRPDARALPWLMLLFTPCCSSAPTAFTLREVARGEKSGMATPLQRAFLTNADYERFGKGVAAKGGFPSKVDGVRWGDEMLAVVFAGTQRRGVRLVVERASELGGALVIVWRVENVPGEKIFADEPAPLPEPASGDASLTPFVLVALPAYDGRIRFLQSRALAAGP